MAQGIDVRLLRTLVEVHRAGTLSGAASVLGISQPAVTEHIRELERRLDRPLFERLPRGVVATGFGEMLALEAAPHIDALQQVMAVHLSGRRGLAGRTLQLGGPAELTSAYIAAALAPLAADGVRLRVSLGLPEDLLRGLGQGRLDLAVTTTRPRGPGLKVNPLWDEELVLVASGARADELTPLLAAGDGDPHILAGEPVVAYAENMPLIRRYWLTAFGVRPPGHPVLVVPDLRAVLAAVAAGIGLSVLPRYVCRSAVEDGTVAALIEPEIPPINTIYLACATGRSTEPQIAAAWELLRRAARRW